MLISLNWLKDFIDIPAGLDPRDLALRFTTTTAEIEGVEQHRGIFSGLVAAKIESLETVAGEAELRQVVVSAGKNYKSLTSAPDVKVGDIVAYAPPGATIGGYTVGTTDSAGRPAEGMIVAWGSLGFPQIGAQAVFLPPATKPGTAIDPAPFDDWVIEIDNKSITHRPDCWGHYGIAREIAAMLGMKLRPYGVTDPASLTSDKLPKIPIEIDDSALCPRYTGLVMKGLRSQPSALAMQARLALCGMRPIDLIVDLTNYIMLELGQPMHAFDGATLPNIQVALASPAEKFTTLDGISRAMPRGSLMIQCNRKSVAIAGVMGGAATEVSAKTQTMLLESANFDAPTVRRAATAMGLRTEASARFEKSLDPAHTVLGIARFHKLAKEQLAELELASMLSDCYPAPKRPQPIELDCDFAGRFIGRPVSPDEITKTLAALEFTVQRSGSKLAVTPPSFRATKDISIEADLIEEVARFIGYNNIEPTLPTVTARYFEPSPALALEERTLDYLCIGGPFVEVHGYIWFEDDWLKKIGFDPGNCITLRNPAADNCSRLRTTLGPGLLQMAERNRHHFGHFNLIEIGSVFVSDVKEIEKAQHRNLGFVVAEAGKKSDRHVWDRLRSALEGWACQVLEGGLTACETKAVRPWEDADRIAELTIGGRKLGRMTLVPLACKQRIDERLKTWSIAMAELDLSVVADLINRHEKLAPLPKYPRVRLDFSVLVEAADRYNSIAAHLVEFRHEMLKRLSFVEAYEGGSIPVGKRSLTLRAEIGREDGTLGDDEIHQFQSSFRDFLTRNGMELRG